MEEPKCECGYEKNYRQVCRGRLPHPAKSECMCAAVLLCDGKIHISILYYLALVCSSVCTQFWDCTVP